ncbi:MAG: hypothetical protein ABIA62_03195 [Candidatus Woesearchaeota archaeon]
MAKISIHIPDEVLKRVRENKDRLNISKVCSTALLKEVEVLSNVDPMVEQTRKLIDRLRKDTHKQHLESFNLGVRMAQDHMSKTSFEQLQFWGTMPISDKSRIILPEDIENILEKRTLDGNMSHPLHRASFFRGWHNVMKQTWSTVKDKI